MSTGFGVNKGKDGKYNTLNLTAYKGRSSDSSKPSGSSVRHGLQVLGKVANTRRVPPPASLPSLKSENLGNDPNVNLVPKDGSGWASKSESSTPPVVTQTPQESQPRQTSVHTQQSMYPASNQTVTSRSANSATVASSGSAQMWGAPRFSQPGNRVSAEAGGAQGHGTTHFSDDFPTLSATQKEQQQGGLTGDKSREAQYGPGPSLRPQNVAAWKEGGGRNLPHQADIPNNDVDDAIKQFLPDATQHSQMQLMQQNNGSNSFEMPISEAGQGQPVGMRPMGQGVGTRHPPYHPNMMPPYMYNSGRFQPPGMLPPGATARYSPGMQQRMQYAPYPNDPRYRNMVMSGHPQQQQVPMDSSGMPSAISQSDFKEFNKLETDDDDGGWATMHGEVDYGEKLVFSDDDETQTKGSSATRDQSEHHDKKPKVPSNQPRHAYGPSQPGVPDQTSVQWRPHPYYGMHPVSPLGQSRNDGRGKSQPSFEKRLPPQGQMYHGPQMHAMYNRHPAVGGPRFPGPSPDMSVGRSSPGSDVKEDQWRKSEKTEAQERARKRREEEERRMGLERRSAGDENFMHHDLTDRSRYPVPAEGADGQWNKFDSVEGMPAFRTRRTESECSDDRRATWQDRHQNDGYNYRAVPHPSSAQVVGGRNLPPRLAQQRQERLGQRGVGPLGQDSYGKTTSGPITRPSIMKRERRESEGSEEPQQGLRSRPVSESQQSFGVAREISDDDSFPVQDRRDNRKLFTDRQSHTPSPSNTSDREHRLWDAGGALKRSSLKRQGSNDTGSLGSSNEDSRRGSLKTLLTRSDGSSKPLTKRGSNHSEKSDGKEDHRQSQQILKPRRTDSKKVTLRDFRVTSDDEEESFTKNRRTGSRKIGGDLSSNEPKMWNNNDKSNKPVATVTSSADTSTKSQKRDPLTKSITRDVVADHSPDPTDDGAEPKERPPSKQQQTSGGPSGSNRRDNRDRYQNAGPRDRRADRMRQDLDAQEESVGHPKRAERYDDKDQYKNSKSRHDRSRGQNADSYRERRDGSRNAAPPRRSDKSDGRRSERYDRNDNRSNDSRYRKDNREQRRDKKDYTDTRENKGRPAQVNRKSENVKNEPARTQSEKPSNSTEPEPSTQSEKKQPQPVAVPAPPPTNVWEERKKQMQQAQIKPDQSLTYVPTEDDKKRTLKETAPVKVLDDAVRKLKDDAKQGHSKKTAWEDNSGGKKFDKYNREDDMHDKKPLDRRSSGYGDNSSRRGSYTASGRGERRPGERPYNTERRGLRGRGRSRGSRGRSGAPPALDKFSSSAPRGRGRSTRRGSRSGPSREFDRPFRSQSNSQSNSKLQDESGEEIEPTADNGSSYSDDEVQHVGRRRQVGETSDTDECSSVENSDEHKQKPRMKADVANSPNRSSKNNNRSSDAPENVFVARGEPSRRGRGRGGFTTGRGRGRGGSSPPRNSTRSASGRGRQRPDSSYRDDPRSSKNGDRGLSASGADDRKRVGPRSIDRRRRKSKSDQPPRFNRNPGRSTARDERMSGVHMNGGVFPKRSDESPSGHEASDGEWETASEENNSDYKKPTGGPNEPDRPRRDDSRNPRRRGRGGKGVSDRGYYDKAPSGRTENQVYMLHTVKYNNPSAIQGALHDASPLQGDENRKFEEDQKAKKQELFRRYDLHNYAGVVNVDDLPEVSAERSQQSDLVSHDNIQVLDSSQPADTIDDDGFTEVLSKRSQKKKQGLIRKKDKEELLEAVRKAKLDQQRQNRQKLLKSGGVKSGSSGSVRQSAPNTAVSSIPGDDVWLKDTFDPEDVSKKTLVEAKVEPSASPHDSGVDTSVPSSQRSSPGTEAKISFSHFSTTTPSTSIVTSICNHEVSSQSPSRSTMNPIGPIGNERVKSAKRSDSVENITSRFHQETNAISFIADSTDEGHQSTTSTLFSGDDPRPSAFSPFGEPPSNPKNDHKSTYSGFASADFTDNSSSADVPHSMPITSYHQIISSPSASVTSDTMTPRSANAAASSDAYGSPHSRSPYRHAPISQPSLGASFLESQTADAQNGNAGAVMNKAGVFSPPDSLKDMNLASQGSTNPNVKHTPTSLEGPIPGPIPMPSTHIPVANQPLDTDANTGVRQTRDVNESATGAADLGLLTPTSPSIDLNLKMESARKAWENMPSEASASSAQQQNVNSNEYPFHASTAPPTSLGDQTIAQSTISTMPSVTLSVTNSSEWKPRHHVSAVVSSNGSDDASWKSSVQQTNGAQNSDSQNTVKSPVAASLDSTPMSMTGSAFGNDSSGSAIMAPTQPTASQFSTNQYMYLNVQPTQLIGQSRLPVQGSQQAALYQQPISTTSLATNLQHMQQVYNSVPPDYSLYSNPAAGYNSMSQQHSHQAAAYSSQPFLASNAIGSAGVKVTAPSAVQIKSNQQGQAANIRGLSTNYGNSLPGLSQQANLGSAQLGVPRPHGGAPSPAQPIYLVEQSRVVPATQGNQVTLVNPSLRGQSTSFYSHLNQNAVGSYYAQQPSSQLRQTPYQQPAIAQPSYQQGLYQQTVKPLSPTPPSQLSHDHSSTGAMGNMQSAYPPIAPPSQRSRTEADYMAYQQPKNTQYPTSSAKGLPPTQFGGMKPNNPPPVGYGAIKSNQSMFAPSVMSSNQDHLNTMQQMHKYSSPSAGSGMKPGMGQASGDWSKPPVSQHFRPNSVQGILSRPFSSAGDSVHHQAPSMQSHYVGAHKPQDGISSGAYPQHGQQSYNNPLQTGWNPPKLVSPQAGSAPQAGPGILGKGPRPMQPTSMINQQRFMPPHTYQSNMMTPQQPPNMRNQAPYQMKQQVPPGGMNMQTPSSAAQQFAPLTDGRSRSSGSQSTAKQNKSKQSGSLHGKTPPVPTLVRGSGSNLAGRKPTYMPQEVVKSNQASERANLLQSLSAFFPEKPKQEEIVDDKKTDWSTHVANSEPLPKRKPGMRHPGVDRKKLSRNNDRGDDRQKRSSAGQKNLKRLQKNAKKEEKAQNATENVTAAAKKLTLADTRPKKGEVSKIK